MLYKIMGVINYVVYSCLPSSLDYIPSHTDHLHYYILRICRYISQHSLVRRTQTGKLKLRDHFAKSQLMNFRCIDICKWIESYLNISIAPLI